MDKNIKIENCSIVDFWKWAYSDVLSNRNRSIYTEYLVAKAFQIDGDARIEWDSKDLVYCGCNIEVKSSAFVQSWEQEIESRMSFDTEKKKIWNPETNTHSKEKQRTWTAPGLSEPVDGDLPFCCAMARTPRCRAWRSAISSLSKNVKYRPVKGNKLTEAIPPLLRNHRAPTAVEISAASAAFAVDSPRTNADQNLYWCSRCEAGGDLVTSSVDAKLDPILYVSLSPSQLLISGVATTTSALVTSVIVMDECVFELSGPYSLFHSIKGQTTVIRLASRKPTIIREKTSITNSHIDKSRPSGYVCEICCPGCSGEQQPKVATSPELVWSVGSEFAVCEV